MIRAVCAVLFGLFCCSAGLAQVREPLRPQPAAVAWPGAEWPTAPLPAGTDTARLERALDIAFAEPMGPMGQTRAVVVIFRGQLVLERYGQGFGPDTRLVSWSMAKSFTQALVGAAVLEGRVAIDTPMGNRRWAAGDPRAATTWRQWLQFTDGLRYTELGATAPQRSDAARMLFGPGRRDPIGFAASLPQIHPAGTVWNYSTASSNLIADALTERLAPGADPAARRAAMAGFMRDKLFGPIGMRSAFPEFAPDGTFLGGSLIYATARDFARFGLLYARDGVWNGTRLLPEGWVDFARTPGPASNADIYGAGWWVQPADGPGRPRTSLYNGEPRDGFSAQGHDGQVILVVPSRDLVVVRLGQMYGPAAPAWDAIGTLTQDIALSLPPVPVQTPAPPAAPQR